MRQCVNTILFVHFVNLYMSPNYGTTEGKIINFQNPHLRHGWEGDKFTTQGNGDDDGHDDSDDGKDDGEHGLLQGPDVEQQNSREESAALPPVTLPLSGTTPSPRADAVTPIPTVASNNEIGEGPKELQGDNDNSVSHVGDIHQVAEDDAEEKRKKDAEQEAEALNKWEAAMDSARQKADDVLKKTRIPNVGDKHQVVQNEEERKEAEAMRQCVNTILFVHFVNLYMSPNYGTTEGKIINFQNPHLRHGWEGDKFTTQGNGDDDGHDDSDDGKDDGEHGLLQGPDVEQQNSREESAALPPVTLPLSGTTPSPRADAVTPIPTVASNNEIGEGPKELQGDNDNSVSHVGDIHQVAEDDAEEKRKKDAEQEAEALNKWEAAMDSARQKADDVLKKTRIPNVGDIHQVVQNEEERKKDAEQEAQKIAQESAIKKKHKIIEIVEKYCEECHIEVDNDEQVLSEIEEQGNEDKDHGEQEEEEQEGEEVNDAASEKEEEYDEIDMEEEEEQEEQDDDDGDDEEDEIEEKEEEEARADKEESDEGETNTRETNKGETNTGETNIEETNIGETNIEETNTGETNKGETNTGELEEENQQGKKKADNPPPSDTVPQAKHQNPNSQSADPNDIATDKCFYGIANSNCIKQNDSFVLNNNTDDKDVKRESPDKPSSATKKDDEVLELSPGLIPGLDHVAGGFATPTLEKNKYGLWDGTNVPPSTGDPQAPNLTADILTATTPVLAFVTLVTIALLGYSLWKASTIGTSSNNGTSQYGITDASTTVSLSDATDVATRGQRNFYDGQSTGSPVKNRLFDDMRRKFKPKVHVKNPGSVKKKPQGATAQNKLKECCQKLKRFKMGRTAWSILIVLSTLLYSFFMSIIQSSMPSALSSLTDLLLALTAFSGIPILFIIMYLCVLLCFCRSKTGKCLLDKIWKKKEKEEAPTETEKKEAEVNKKPETPKKQKVPEKPEVPNKQEASGILEVPKKPEVPEKHEAPGTAGESEKLEAHKKPEKRKHLRKQKYLRSREHLQN
ncbi:hypothetical protein AK88_05051 [Plasmodium fragile]|uniref:Uncharacterized protein n=1 Tax=Plasmodium fragile TaxID=5857 RepID=A0A0D9QE90_PLAFR|nr:uncharacterized protein AK88_05051 [Plasmodium fragile]KJP85318.1 hypothetical protein AK88_05051 [Plasmodium fragile]